MANSNKTLLFFIYYCYFLVDITCYYDGFHADLNETLFVGKVDEESQKLVKTAYDSLMAAVNEGFSLYFLCMYSPILEAP